MQVIKRDPKEMKKFAENIDYYSVQMKSACSSLKNSFASASANMGDENSKKALSRLNSLTDSLLVDLPNLENFADKLRESAKYLEEAQNLF